MRTRILPAVLTTTAAGLLVAAFVFQPTGMTPSMASDEAATALARADELSAGFRQVARRTLPAVVSIRSTRKIESPRMTQLNDPFGRGFPGGEGEELPFRGSPFEDLFRQFDRGQMMPEGGPDGLATGEGSGFIFDASGLVMTNSHVVRGADEVIVTLADGREFTVTDIKSDDFSDVAVLRIDAGEKLPALTLGDDSKMEIGDWVLAIGSPFGLDLSVTQGIISAKSRGLKQSSMRQEFLQTDAAINPGNSGGPLVNLKGEVVGINTAIETRSGGYDGVSFAVPVSLARWVSDQLVTNGKVRRAYLGVRPEELDSEAARALELKANTGVVVAAVTKGSPADAAGVRVQDVIVSLNGRPVRNRQQLIAVAERMVIGEQYPLVVLRDGDELELSVTAAEFPEQLADASEGAAVDSLGIEAQPLTPELSQQLDLDLEKGVVITNVQRGSLAARFGLRPGSVITRIGKTEVATVEDLEQGLQAAAEKGQLVLEVRTSDGSQLLSVPFGGQ